MPFIYEQNFFFNNFCSVIIYIERKREEVFLVIRL